MAGVRGTGMMNCPFCGGRRLTLEYTAAGQAFVMCGFRKCLSQGPVADVELEAVRLWNQRKEGAYFRAAYLADSERLQIEVGNMADAAKRVLGVKP